MAHIVLLGDSVFDNAPYVDRGRDVASTLRSRLPPGWRTTLLARDGAVLADLPEQVRRVPADATHLVVSAGGNDALGWTGLFQEPVASVGEALRRLARVRREFRSRYGTMLETVASLGRPTAICTIYDVRFPEEAFREMAVTALTVLNDVVTREAGERRLDLLDLRSLLDEDADFANPIEPSAQGSRKLADAILEVAGRPPAARPILLGGRAD